MSYKKKRQGPYTEVFTSCTYFSKRRRSCISCLIMWAHFKKTFVLHVGGLGKVWQGHCNSKQVPCFESLRSTGQQAARADRDSRTHNAAMLLKGHNRKAGQCLWGPSYAAAVLWEWVRPGAAAECCCCTQKLLLLVITGEMQICECLKFCVFSPKCKELKISVSAISQAWWQCSRCQEKYVYTYIRTHEVEIHPSCYFTCCWTDLFHYRIHL